MEIQSLNLSENAQVEYFGTVVDHVFRYTAFGVGSMTAENVQLTDSAKRVLVALSTHCSVSEGWTKELTFFQIVAAGSVAERVHDALHTSKARSAIFFCLPLERNLL
ncbi:hypothetical protein [Caballeronia sordidicola]|uniref:hypothetical protein n=1 Tax=Caballeronia sordidicola TaxID=196367 RepID=UPI000B7897E5|nr:hypothetical protein [Caballeronia sordidicola]